MYRRRVTEASVNLNAPFKPVISRPSSSGSPPPSRGSTTAPPPPPRAVKRTSSTLDSSGSSDSSVEISSVKTDAKIPPSSAPPNPLNGLSAKRPKLSEPTQTVARSGLHKPVVSNPLARVSLPIPSIRREAPQANGNAKYFEVVWRKATSKKNKTWDGDGLLTLTADGTVMLEDSKGKHLAKSRISGELTVDSFLKMGYIEVEISAVVNEKEKDTLFLSTTILPLVKTKIAPTSFHSPLADAHQSTFTASGGISRPGQKGGLTVRHDPNALNSFLLPRPVNWPQGKTVVDVVVDPLLGKFLRPHQVLGVQFLYECVLGYRSYQGRGALLADEMGLGKTLMTIALIWTLLKQSPIEGSLPVIQRALIVCPVTLINNWKKEFRKWLGPLRVGVFVVDGKANIRNFVGSRVYQVIIVGYERLRSISPYLKKANIDLVVCDEGHRLKSSTNKSAQAILSLPTQRRIILSGTPIQNDLGEFFTMVDFLNPGILGTYATFKKEFEVPILKSRQPEAISKDIEKGRVRSEELSKLTRLFTLRRTADTLDKYLPPKTDAVIFCRPTPKQAALYKMVVESSSIKKCLGSNMASDHLRAITMLKKLCNSPALLKDSDFDFSNTQLPPTLPYPGGKLHFLVQFLRSLYENTSEKVVVVSGYTQTLDIIEDTLNSAHFTSLRLDGSTPANKRQQLVDNFNRSSNKDSFVFLLSAKSGGTGLNLIGASRLFLFDTDWNPSVDLQAMARVHRDGQKRPVFVYRLLITGAMDEKIYQRQITKQSLAESFMDGNSNDGENKRKLTSVTPGTPKTLRKSSAGVGGSGTNSFSLAELQDLFTFHENTNCHTHDLLGCTCQSSSTEPAAAAPVAATASLPIASRKLLGEITYDELMKSNSELLEVASSHRKAVRKRSRPATRDGSDGGSDSENSSGCFLENDTDDEKECAVDVAEKKQKESNRLGGWTTARDVVEGTAPVPQHLREKAKCRMKGLFEYKHIDVDLFLARHSQKDKTRASPSPPKESEFFIMEDSGDEAGGVDAGNDGSPKEEPPVEDDSSIDDELYIGDDILTQVLRDKKTLVSYIFTKCSLESKKGKAER